MSRVFAGFAAIVLLSAASHIAQAATSTPGSIDPVPATPPAATTPPAPAPAPAATPPATPTPAATPAPAATTAPSTAAPDAKPPAPAGETATTPATPEIKKKKSKRRYARYGTYRYPYRGPLFYAHPRFWWPFYRPRYRYYRHPRRYYYGPPFPFYMFR